MPTRGRRYPRSVGGEGRPAPRGERGRGLLLVEALSARWDWYLTKEPNGKVVWCEIAALSPGPDNGCMPAFLAPTMALGLLWARMPPPG
jgi:hypothetical protein